MDNFHKTCSLYESFFKRLLDLFISMFAIIMLFPLLLILTIIGTVAMKGNPFFVQKRPGKINNKTGKEKIFSLIKFRTMSNEKDEKGNFLPDEMRLNAYGKFLRSTSFDELPELINIIRGDMSIIGPRPQLVKDMVFMSNKQRMRHVVKPGLSGLAQVMGRNAITWEEKLGWDLKYIENINFLNDIKIILLTMRKIIGHNTSLGEIDITDDYGDALLKAGKISKETYDVLQMYAKQVLEGK